MKTQACQRRVKSSYTKVHTGMPSSPAIFAGTSSPRGWYSLLIPIGANMIGAGILCPKMVATRKVSYARVGYMQDALVRSRTFVSTSVRGMMRHL